MPELPEVETTRRGVGPHLVGHRIERVVVRDRRLRWPVPDEVRAAEGRCVERLDRRAKYLLASLGQGGLLMHLGMSGSLRIVPADAPPRTHDHYDLVLDDGRALRFNDPRRFGALLWFDAPAAGHPLLRDLGPEPLGPDFSGAMLHAAARGRRVPVKNFIMNAHVVVGVGNIYASEALFMAGIHPHRPAGRVSRARYDALAAAIRDVLGRAIRRGGTTLRDFVGVDGEPGYFAQELLVYGRAGQPCLQCGATVRQRVIGQRSSFYCIACQR